MRKTISIFANIAILSFYIYFIVVKWDVFRNLLDIRIHYLLILTILIILTWFANAFQAKLLLDSQGVKIGLFKNVLLICASVLGNHLPFRLGTLYRMHYLKKNFNVNYQQFGSIIVFRFLLLIVLTGMIGIVCVGYIYFTYHRFNIGFCLLMIAFVGLPLGGYWLQKTYLFNRLPQNRFWNKFEVFNSSLGIFSENRALMFKISLFILLQIIIFTLRFFVSSMLLNERVPLIVLFLMSPIAITTSLLVLTPGGIGFRETLLGIVSQLTGYGFDSGVFMATVDRGVLIAATLIFGAISYVALYFAANPNQVKSSIRSSSNVQDKGI
jgi:uncharacterized membrane protein YbhN (UPF0104 family)